MKFYAAQILALFAWIFVFISYYKNKDDRILVFQIIGCIFFGLSYYLLGAWTGFFIIIYDIIRNLMYIKSNEDKKIFFFSLPIFLLITIFSYNGIYSIIAVIASMIDGYALIYKGEKVVLLAIFSYLLWIVYDYYSLSITNIIAEILIIISNIMILVRGHSFINTNIRKE